VKIFLCWGPFLTSPIGANFTPRGEFAPPGVKISPGGEILCLPLHSSQQQRVFTPGGERRGEHSPLGDNIDPWMSSSPLGMKFTPGGQGWSYESPSGRAFLVVFRNISGGHLPVHKHLGTEIALKSYRVKEQDLYRWAGPGIGRITKD
jgi:hypothetical protein